MSERRRSSAATRAAYLARTDAAISAGPARGKLACANLAHGFAAADEPVKSGLRSGRKPNVAIVSSYNDMLSAHQPFRDVPEVLKKAIVRAGGLAQFAGGVPAMCDGITQGRAGAGGGVGAGEVGGAGRGAAPRDAVGDLRDHRVGAGVTGAHSVSCQDRPSRSRSVTAATGPCVPAG